MDALRDWYQYLDEVSRPVRRPEDPEAGTPAWRPWSPEAGEEAGPAALSVPQLALPPAGFEALHPATVEFDDPTVDDELEPIPQFEVPTLRPPTFVLPVPSLGRTGGGAAEGEGPEPLRRAPEPEPAQHAPVSPAPRSEPAAVPEPADIGAKGGALSAPERGETDAGEIARRKAAVTRRQEFLERLQRSGAETAGRGARREDRDELIQRLFDPVLTLEETALFLDVCPTTVRRYTNRGLLRHFRTPGNQRRFRLSDVLEFQQLRGAEIEADAAAERAGGTRGSDPELRAG